MEKVCEVFHYWLTLLWQQWLPQRFPVIEDQIWTSVRRGFAPQVQQYFRNVWCEPPLWNHAKVSHLDWGQNWSLPGVFSSGKAILYDVLLCFGSLFTQLLLNFRDNVLGYLCNLRSLRYGNEYCDARRFCGENYLFSEFWSLFNRAVKLHSHWFMQSNTTNGEAAELHKPMAEMGVASGYKSRWFGIGYSD